MKDISNIMSYWDFEDKVPRQNQIKALNWIEANKTKKYFILQAPVGSGKSLCGLTASRFLSGNKGGSSFILTPQKILQEQYEKDFVDSGIAFSLYGKSNYFCASKHSSCGIGSIIKPPCSVCPYKQAKKKAEQNPNVILNYQLALTSFAYTDNFNKRTLMVLDECHTAEQFLVDFDAINITKFLCETHDIPWINTTNLVDIYQWIKSKFYPKLEQYYKKLENLCDELRDQKGNQLTQSEIKMFLELDQLGELIDKLDLFKAYPIDKINDEYLLSPQNSAFTVKRITGIHAFKHILEPKADKFLFMSGTILDPKAFCHDLGIDPSQSVFLSLDSDFPIENRPICFIPTMKMNASWNDNSPSNIEGRKQMIENLIKILDLHKNESGVLHTANFQIATWLVKELSGKISQQIWNHNPDTKDDRGAIIKAFTQSNKPGLLISPSVTEGLDLKDDLGRFAIFAKVAFPFLGDQWILKRKNISNEWYTRKTIIDVMQGCGRVVRSENDTGSIYILDSSFQMLLNSTRHLLPKWWLDSIETI